MPTLLSKRGSLCVLLCVVSGCGYGGWNGRTSVDIWQAVENEDLVAIEGYAIDGGDLEVGADSRGETPLLHALRLGKKRSYQKLLEVGASPNTECRGGGDILPKNSGVIHHAAYEADPFWLEAALKTGGDPDLMNSAKGTSSGTPVLFAIGGKGGVQNVTLLCEHGADVDLPCDHLGRTPLSDAARQTKFDIVAYLLEHGADPGSAGTAHEGNSFIHFMREKKPELYADAPNPEYRRSCQIVWDWLQENGKDPDKAKWNGERWTWE